MPIPAGSDTALWRLPAVRQLVLMTLLGFTGFAATLASLPWWAVRGGATVSSAGLVTTVMLATTVATQGLVPAMVRRLGSGRSLAIGLVALGAPSALYVLSTDLGPLLAVSALRGTGFAVLTVVGSTLTRQVSPEGRHGETAGLYGLAIAVPNLVVVPGAVALAQNVGFWPVAVLATLPVLAVPLALASGGRRPAAGADPAVVGHRAAVLTALAPSLVLLVVTLAGGGLLTYLPIERPEGLVATAALLLFGVSGALGRWRAGVLADRVGARLLLPASVVAAALGLVGAAAGLANGSDTLLLAGATVCGAGYGAVQNLTLVIAFARVGPEQTPTASAVWNAAFDTGTGVGAVAVGALAAVGAAGGSGGLGVPVALGACALLVALVLPVALRSGASHPIAT
ncbi:MAG TPA: MFS transporter [Actinomycetales bacterium]|nr:MFS transporter [Actinomycetales bacterium]